MVVKAKYMIHATIKADGTIQRKDGVGAIFGQTEGLLGEELQLRKLQRWTHWSRGCRIELQQRQGIQRDSSPQQPRSSLDSSCRCRVGDHQ